VVSVLVWQWIFNDLYGILNSVLLRWGVIDQPVIWLGKMPNAMISVVLVGTWKFFPCVVIAVLARLQTIPDALYEAAMLDGASGWGRFWDITVPQLRGVLLIVTLLRFIWDFKEFDLIFLLTGGGPSIGTQTLPLMVYKYAFALLQMGKAAAVAVTMLLVMLALFVIYFRVASHYADEKRR
jgi:multiple sugar transport system permease protein